MAIIWQLHGNYMLNRNLHYLIELIALYILLMMSESSMKSLSFDRVPSKVRTALIEPSFFE